MAAKKRDGGRIFAIELTARSMLCLLENGFEPKGDEKFIDRLFGQHDKMTGSELARFKKYIGAHGTDEEKARLSKLK
ncbi:hypothetical protein A2851_03520 [Candidatus Kaiserbacteria bacterium RIFCSPHIGHO2_01_FULL_53_29]|uniref:Uncharacterized protein n=1 Tax=Candidatus Kaiserbacteria bacterium RIFCSPHIGHO2_01_FULL_53_29 TaxID=1798480 RepID=A0A1F6CYH3_9BACT|nr:MAG: hypothetical protein A2851_03520 [Candidatus Kaiserbacteria bacterium RIFCSPHIGHO2_01_FULL_53_29]